MTKQRKRSKAATKALEKRILVTGGMGFIGHKVVEKLQKQNYKVEVIDVLTTYGLLDKEELEYLYNERLRKFRKDTKIHKVDIAEIEQLNSVFEQAKPDYVIHLASFPNDKLARGNPVEAAHTMCQGLANVLENSVRHGVKKILYVSSSMVLGSFSDETSPQGVTELHNTDPSGTYGIWKRAGEQLLEQCSKDHGLDYTTVRPSAVYGPLDNSNRVVGQFLINSMRDKKLSVNGDTERLDFTYIDDLAKGIIDALFKGKKGIYHLTRGQSATIKHVAETIVKLVGKGTVEIKEKDTAFPSRGTLNISKAKTDFNFDPKISIDNGLEMYYNWIKDAEFYKEK
tara:strand:- start:838 stop:1860 length:1023 start_codon:yes stop_codon:yes gene_type:complete